MSRAFTKENDIWSFCIKEHEACMFAYDNGECSVEKCKKEDGAQKQNNKKAPGKVYGTIRINLPD